MKSQQYLRALVAGLLLALFLSPARAEDLGYLSLKTDYSVHPILGTRTGERLQGVKVPIETIEKLGNVAPDLNYFAHALAERDAMESYCKQVSTGQTTIGPPTYSRRHGFTVVDTYYKLEPIEGRCEDAHVGQALYESNGKFYQDSLKHPFLNTSIFKGLSVTKLDNATFKSLNQTFPLSTDSNTYSYIIYSHCFRTTEVEAAKAFIKQMHGLTQNDIRKIVGNPVASDGPVKCWGDTGSDISNMIYELGYEEVPVRLILKKDKCVDGEILSTQKRYMYSAARWAQFKTVEEELARETVTQKRLLEMLGKPIEIISSGINGNMFKYGTGRLEFSNFLIKDGVLTSVAPNNVSRFRSNEECIVPGSKDQLAH